jgi:hypothetical protein
MTFWKREATRRQAITGAALGTLAASYPLSLRAAKPTTQEKANIKVGPSGRLAFLPGGFTPGLH